MSTQSTDVLDLSFISPITQTVKGNIKIASGNEQGIGNYTTVAFEKDFFKPANGITFTIGSSDLSSITKFMQRGYQVLVKINGNFQMYAYIFDYHVRINRHGGTELEVHCKDLLEYMAQGSIPPNMGVGPNTFRFQSNITIQDALTTITHNFSLVTGTPISIEVENNASLTFASGFKTGVKRKINPSFAKVRSKSISTALAHLSQPDRGGHETYLSYMVKLIEHIGGNIKMSDIQPNVIFVKPPTYDRVPIQGLDQSPFKLFHYTTKNVEKNNVISAEYYFNGDHQPSVVIMEANSTNNAVNYQAAVKGIAINELTGLPSPQSELTPSTDITSSNPNEILSSFAIPSVQVAIVESTAGKNGTGWFLAPINPLLYSFRSAFPIDTYTNVALPHYGVNDNAHTTGVEGETCYAASKYLAQCQDKFIEMVYHVDGWTYSDPVSGAKYVWQPDYMITIMEETFSPGNPQEFNMWIRSVTYTKNRSGGTETKLICTLPYTHNFEITP